MDTLSQYKKSNVIRVFLPEETLTDHLARKLGFVYPPTKGQVICKSYTLVPCEIPQPRPRQRRLSWESVCLPKMYPEEAASTSSPRDCKYFTQGTCVEDYRYSQGVGEWGIDRDLLAYVAPDKMSIRLNPGMEEVSPCRANNWEGFYPEFHHGTVTITTNSDEGILSFTLPRQSIAMYCSRALLDVSDPIQIESNPIITSRVYQMVLVSLDPHPSRKLSQKMRGLFCVMKVAEMESYVGILLHLGVTWDVIEQSAAPTRGSK